MLNVCTNYAKYTPKIIAFKGSSKISALNNNPKTEACAISQSYPISYELYSNRLNTRRKILENFRPNLLSNTKIDYRKWLEQFETNEEKYLAVRMLENYFYIDTDNARCAFRKLYLDLSEETDISKTNFATFGTAKSGSYMGYLFRQANKLRSKGTVSHEYSPKDKIQKDKFITSDQLGDVEFNKEQKKKGMENIAIIDDIIGDGDSFIEYLTPEIYNSLKQYKNVYYLTLVKDPDGEKRVKERFPDLNIKFRTAQEVYKYDSKENKNFSDYEKAKIDYMLKKYGEKINPSLVEKYSRSKLFVSFDWNTPGNSPMIFNVTNSNWNGLFQRYNGLEEGDVGAKFNFLG